MGDLALRGAQLILAREGYANPACLGQRALLCCHPDGKGTKGMSPASSAKLLVPFPCALTPICAFPGLPAPLDTSGGRRTNHPAPSRDPL